MILDQELIDDAKAIEKVLSDDRFQMDRDIILIIVQRLRKALDSRDDYLQSIGKLADYMEHRQRLRQQ